jgi:double-stranded uracil-DNA glycosylase
MLLRQIYKFCKGGKELERKVLEYKPKNLAILGIDTYRKAFDRPKAKMGLQVEKIGNTKIFILPNPSGLNAHYRAEELVRMFMELKKLVNY